MNNYGVSIQVKGIGYISDELAEALAFPDIGICGIDPNDGIVAMSIENASRGNAIDFAIAKLWDRFSELDVEAVCGEVRVWRSE